MAVVDSEQREDYSLPDSDVPYANFMAADLHEMLVMSRLLQAVREIHPESSLRFYGSYVNGFRLPWSDLDISWEVPNIPRDDALKALHDLLAQDSSLWWHLTLRKARIPILRVYDPSIGIYAEVSVRNTMAVFNSDLLRRYANVPHVAAFIKDLKTWSSAVLPGAWGGGMSAYAMCIVGLFFLIETDVVLPVDEILEGKKCAGTDKVISLRDFCAHMSTVNTKEAWRLYIRDPFIDRNLSESLSIDYEAILFKAMNTAMTSDLELHKIRASSLTKIPKRAPLGSRVDAGTLLNLLQNPECATATKLVMADLRETQTCLAKHLLDNTTWTFPPQSRTPPLLVPFRVSLKTDEASAGWSGPTSARLSVPAQNDEQLICKCLPSAIFITRRYADTGSTHSTPRGYVRGQQFSAHAQYVFSVEVLRTQSSFINIGMAEWNLPEETAGLEDQPMTLAAFSGSTEEQIIESLPSNMRDANGFWLGLRRGVKWSSFTNTEEIFGDDFIEGTHLKFQVDVTRGWVQLLESSAVFRRKGPYTIGPMHLFELHKTGNRSVFVPAIALYSQEDEVAINWSVLPGS